MKKLDTPMKSLSLHAAFLRFLAPPRRYGSYLRRAGWDYIPLVFFSGVGLSPLGSTATSGLFQKPQMKVIVEQLVEWRLAGETEVLGANLPQRHFVNHKSHMTRPGKTATNRLSYGAALLTYLCSWHINVVRNDIFTQKGSHRIQDNLYHLEHLNPWGVS
jgi:hypothetical protein